MHYVSTRGEAPRAGFADVLLTGLARDGGLYVPESWPNISADALRSLRGRPYAEVAEAFIAPFVGEDIEAEALSRIIAETYSAFGHPAVAPLVQIDANDWVLELFHGPTLAFKDIAMQLLGRLMDHVLAARGARATIVGATSGDTGSAAIDAFRGRERVDIFVLFPVGRVSEVQRRQMTTVPDGNVHALAVEGNFDDCQALVKAMFNHHSFRDRYALSGVNSINWARIVAQTVYYATSALALGAPERRIAFSVPTGNFGNILAGEVARRMGVPIERLVIASNRNDILPRALQTGTYEVRGVEQTQSPSMDIQVSSNFERLLFEAHGREAGAIRRAMDSLTQSGRFTIADEAASTIRQAFEAVRVDEDETRETIARTYRACGYLADPHTAVGLAGAQARRGDPATPMVTLATAHPAKFPDAVEQAMGVRPALPLALADLLDREERMTVLPNNIGAIEAHIAALSRTTLEAAL